MVAAGQHEAAGVLGDSEDKTAEAPNIALEYGKWLMSSCTAPVGVEALCRLGNISTAMQLLFVLIFMCVETSGAAGGTSGVAGTPITLLPACLLWFTARNAIWAGSAVSISSRGHGPDTHGSTRNRACHAVLPLCPSLHVGDCALSSGSQRLIEHLLNGSCIFPPPPARPRGCACSCGVEAR
jgi:hypothetical protein